VASPLLVARRTGGPFPPHLEVLGIADGGTFRLWRTIADATCPPSPVGAFGGRLPTDDLARVQALAPDTDLAPPRPDDAAGLRVELAKRTFDGPADAAVDGTWGAVLGEVRGLLATLTGLPTSAVGLDIAADRRSARLRHLGSRPLIVDLTYVAVGVTALETADGQTHWRWTGDLSEGQPEADATGWSVDLPFEHDLPVDGPLTVDVEVGIAFELDELPGVPGLASPADLGRLVPARLHCDLPGPGTAGA
jgi:hypothetical protein